MGKAALLNQGGGAKINGVVDEYVVAAGESVSAGDFVEFVNEWNGNTAVASTINKAETIDSERILLTRFPASSGSGSVYAQVVSFANNTITFGSRTNVASSMYGSSDYGVSSAVLSSTTAVVVGVGSNSGSYVLKAIVLSISGLTITVSSTTILEDKLTVEAPVNNLQRSGSTSCYYVGSQITYTNGATSNVGYKYVINITIGSSSASSYSVTKQASSSNASHATAGNYIWFYTGGSTYTASSSAFVGPQTLTLQSYSTAAKPTQLLMGSLGGLINRGVVSGSLYCMLLRMTTGTGSSNGLSIISSLSNMYNTCVTPVNKSIYANYAAIQAMPNGDLIVVYGSSTQLRAAIFEIIDTTPTLKSDSVVIDNAPTSGNLNVCALNNNTIAITFGTSVYLMSYQAKVKIATDLESVAGVAKNSGNAGQTVKINVPQAA